jgi:GTP cyclohydrolase I
LPVPADAALGPDVAATERAVAALLAALGVPAGSEVARNTPRRVAAALVEQLTPCEFDLTTFPNAAGHDELVLVRRVPFRSVCAHHLLPFTGMAHVGYLPGERLLGLSKLARAVDLFARRLQVQEEMTQQIAGWLEKAAAARGVGVVVTAEHLCMTLRGACATGSSAVTVALRGALRAEPRRAEFLALAQRAGTAA